MRAPPYKHIGGSGRMTGDDAGVVENGAEGPVLRGNEGRWREGKREPVEEGAVDRFPLSCFLLHLSLKVPENSPFLACHQSRRDRCLYESVGKLNCCNSLAAADRAVTRASCGQKQRMWSMFSLSSWHRGQSVSNPTR